MRVYGALAIALVGGFSVGAFLWLAGAEPLFALSVGAMTVLSLSAVLWVAILLVPNPPERRRFRFSLRTMFVVVTLFGVWLGYELNWLRQRRWLLGLPGIVVTRNFGDGPVPVTAPGLLWIFGESGYWQIYITTDCSGPGERVQQAEQLFPESKVSTFGSCAEIKPAH